MTSRRTSLHRAVRLAGLVPAALPIALVWQYSSHFRQSSVPGQGCAPPVAAPRVPEIPTEVFDSLMISLDLPNRVRQGEEVRFTLRVENVSTRRLILYLRGREIVFDASVADIRGNPVWRRLEAEILPAILRIEPLDVGGVLELSAGWDQREGSGAAVPPGVYCIHSELLTDGVPVRSPTVQFEVEAGSTSPVSNP